MSDLRQIRSAAVSDERGAIMVMGIFMCTCLVGALWYIAGIGDAVVYRERLQEAADATAMTTAVLHARGMNIIVMVNLAMAAVLAIRVALKVLQVALAFATIIVTGCALVPLPFNPAQPICAIAAPLLGEADELVQEIINMTNPAIDALLEGLNVAAKGLAHLIPYTSVGGGVVIGNKYQPFIDHAGAVPPLGELAGGIPVTDGTTERLCSEAGTAVMNLIKDITPGVARPVIGFVNPLFQAVLTEGGDYFCGLGGNSKPPTFDELTQKQAKKRCDMEYDQKVDDMNTAEQKWKESCGTLHLTCLDRYEITYRYGQQPQSEIVEDDIYKKLNKSKKVEDQKALTDVRGLEDVYETKYSEMETFRRQMSKCRKDTEKQIKDKLAKSQSQAGSGGGKEPRKVNTDWKNGVANGQMVSLAKADSSRGSLLNIGPKGVRIGTLQSSQATAMTPPQFHDWAYAQAEFFYDCSGAWDGDDCNGTPRPDLQHTKDNEEAMWHLRWRARLRRFNGPFDAEKALVELNDGANLIRLGDAWARSASVKSLLNVELRTELLQTDPKDVELH